MKTVCVQRAVISSISERLEAVIVSLMHNLAVAKLEKDGKMGSHLLSRGERPHRDRKNANP
jgi:hypothetical protein